MSKIKVDTLESIDGTASITVKEVVTGISEIAALQIEVGNKVNSVQEEAVGTIVNNIIVMTATEYAGLTVRLANTTYLLVG